MVDVLIFDMSEFVSENADKVEPAMSAQQRRFSSGKIQTYKEFVVGAKSWPSFFAFELYSLFFSGLPGLLGLGSRSLLLPFLLKRCRGGLVVGRGVTIRQPHCISLGKGVIVDDFAVLDVRDSEDSSESKKVEIDIDDRVFVGRGTTIAAKGGRVSLAKAVNIGSDCRIATQTSITVGESSLIAAYCYIGPGNHLKGEDGQSLIENQMELKGGVSIGEHCWIGARATILDGVTIGDGAIVGAHSLVRENVPPNSVVAGCPAKVISKS